MTTYTFATPVSIGNLTDPMMISSVQVTGIAYTSTPSLAPIGTGQLSILLTDPGNGGQQTINYMDASVLAFWAGLVSATSEKLGDVISGAIFAKLISDGKLPAGTISIS